MNKLYRFKQRFKGLSQSSGFTLTELLVSAAIISSAVAISGAGLSAIISSSTAVNESNERRDELSRALDFISAEIREADTINLDSIVPKKLSEFTNKIPKTVTETTVEPIVWLEVKSRKVVYYTARPSSPKGPWGGQQIVYRWGPNFLEDGTYGNKSEHSILIDSLYSPKGSGNTFSCPTGLKGVSLPAKVVKELGFYACVHPDNKMASLIQVGQVDKVLGKTESMRNDRQVYSRASFSLEPGGPVETSSVISNTTDTCTDPTCLNPNPPKDENPITTTSTGYSVSRDLIELKLSHMGGSITCGAGGPNIPTVTTVLFEKPDGSTSSLELTLGSVTETNIPKGTKISFTAKRKTVGRCGEYTVSSRFDLGTQIIALDNGAAIPRYQPFDDQDKIGKFLSDYLIDNKIAIGVNQKVFLFEVGETYSSNPSSAYDLQDIVLMADMTPRESKINTTVNNGVVEETTVTRVTETIREVNPPSPTTSEINP